MTTRRRLRWNSVLAVYTLLVVASCRDAGLTAPMPSTSDFRPLVFGAPAPPQMSIEDEFLAIADANPGFGGLYVDEAGNPIILNKGEPANRTLRAEAVLRVAARSGAFSGVSVSGVRAVKYSFLDLAAIRREFRTLVGTTGAQVGLGIDIRSNRIVLRGSSSELKRLEAAAAAAGLPVDAFELVVDSIAQAVSLRGVVRPVTGGLAISFGSDPDSWCSAGLQAWQNDASGNPDPSLGRFVLTASHCTDNTGAVTGVTFGQPHRGHGLHATEVWDSPLFTGPGCPYGATPCQVADVAVLQMSDSVGSTWQRVAKSNTSSPPTYLGQLSLNTSVWSAVQGQPVRKVGATSGQRNGTVASTCFDILVAGRYILCNVEVQGYSNGGDSGGPVYTPLVAAYPGSPWPSGIYHSYNLPQRSHYWFSSVGAIYAAFGGLFTI